jgi:hypothetical protein
MKAVFLLAFLLASFVAQSVSNDVEQAVRDWYKAFEGSAGVRAQYQGYVGGWFTRAYDLLAPALKDKMSPMVFEETYAEVAHVQLLQAHLIASKGTTREGAVFVEEERTVVFKNAVPAVAWYEGTLQLTRTPDGWRITAIDVHPEDLISVSYGGHQPWRNDPVEVARIAVQPIYGVSALPASCTTRAPALESGIADIDVCGDSRTRVRVVKLHSGEWRVINVESRP